MKESLEDKKTKRYGTFIGVLRAVYARDERLYKFVCESLPSEALKLKALSLPRPFHSKDNMNRRPETILAIRLAPGRCCEPFELEVVKYGQGGKSEV